MIPKSGTKRHKTRAREISKLELGADANLRNATESEFLSFKELMLQLRFAFARGQEDGTVYFRNTM